jgi:hypothetical protein
MEKSTSNVCFSFGNQKHEMDKNDVFFKCSNSAKINSSFIQQLCHRLCFDKVLKKQIELKLKLLRDNEKKFGERIYAILVRNQSQNSLKIINLHPDFFTLFYCDKGTYFKVNSQLSLSNKMIPIKLKIFGVYFNGFNIGLRAEVILLLFPYDFFFILNL